MRKLRANLWVSFFFSLLLIPELNLCAQISLHKITDDHESEVFFLTVSGQYAYACDFAGFSILDVSNPGNPTSVTNLSIDAGAVTVSGNFAYVGEDNGNLDVYLITNPGNVLHVGTTTGPQTSQVLDMLFMHGYVFMTSNAYMTGKPGLSIFSVINPGHPVFLGYPTNYPSVEPDGMALSGQYLYLANGTDGLRIFDVSNPASPINIGHIGDSNADIGSVSSVAVAGQYAYLAGSGLHVCDISNPSNPLSVGSVNPGGISSEITVNGNFAYLAVYPFGVIIYDISDPTNPTEVARSNSGTLGATIALGPYAYVYDGYGLNIYEMQPQLTCSPMITNTLLISWPAPASFALQQCTDLKTKNWVSLTNAITVAGARNQTTLPVPGTQSFYRLKSE